MTTGSYTMLRSGISSEYFEDRKLARKIEREGRGGGWEEGKAGW